MSPFLLGFQTKLSAFNHSFTAIYRRWGAPVCEHVGQAESVVILLGENLEKFFHVVVTGKPVKHGVQ